MKPRDRVMQALNHQEPDRIPIDLGATIVTSITNRTYLELGKYLGLPIQEIKVLDYVQQLPYVSEALLRRFDVDFRMVQLPAATTMRSGNFRGGRLSRFLRSLGFEVAYAQGGRLLF